jgi:dTMP kinase
MKKGLFISVEGLDGSGKTTQAKEIEKHLNEKGYRTLLLREPGGTPIGEKIRKILLDPKNAEMDEVAEMLLYAASRAQITAEKILPALEDGCCVISDRFIDSSIAYQGYGRQLNVGEVTEVNLAAVRHTIPDITFFIDKPPEDSLKRRRESSKADRLENEEMDFHKRVYKGYRELCDRDPGRIKQIDGNRDIEAISSEITGILNKLLERE